MNINTTQSQSNPTLDYFENLLQKDEKEYVQLEKSVYEELKLCAEMVKDQMLASASTYNEETIDTSIDKEVYMEGIKEDENLANTIVNTTEIKLTASTDEEIQKLTNEIAELKERNLALEEASKNITFSTVAKNSAIDTYNKIKTGFTKLRDNCIELKDKIVTTCKGFRDNIKNGFNAIRDNVNKIYEKAKETVNDTVDKAKDTAVKAGETAKNVAVKTGKIAKDVALVTAGTVIIGTEKTIEATKRGIEIVKDFCDGIDYTVQKYRADRANENIRKDAMLDSVFEKTDPELLKNIAKLHGFNIEEITDSKTFNPNDMTTTEVVDAILEDFED